MSAWANYLVAAACLCWAGPNDPAPPPRRVYSYRQAEQARRLARQECKPLVVHFVPDSQLGKDQLQAMYSGDQAAAADLLDDVVIVVVPTEKYSQFARRLGVDGPGGLRTISAYDLSTMDSGAVPTCRSGFI